MLVEARDEEELKKKDEMRWVRRATYAFGGIRMGSDVVCAGGVAPNPGSGGNDVLRVGNGGGLLETVGVCGYGDDGLVMDSVLNLLAFFALWARLRRESLRHR